MQIDIPPDELNQIQPRVDQFLTAFRQLELGIPLETDSALTYDPVPEADR